MKIMAIVGSSICDAAAAARASRRSVMVSPIVIPSTPAIARMSPRRGLVSSIALQPFERVELRDLASSGACRRSLAIADLVADAERARRRRGRWRAGRGSRCSRGWRPAAAAAPSGRRRARGMCSRMASKSGRRSVDRRRPASSLAMPGARVGVDDREVELVLGGVEVDEEVVDLVQHLLDPGVRPVDLVDDDDRRQLASSAFIRT